MLDGVLRRDGLADRRSHFAVVDALATELDEAMQPLPALNLAAEAGADGVRAFCGYVSPRLEVAATLLRAELSNGRVDRLHARRLLGLIGHFVSAGERHVQGSGAAQGAYLRQIKGLEEVMLELGAVGSHVPRDSLHTLFFWPNPRRPYTFTDEPDEAWNASVVKETQLQLTRACDHIRPIREGLVSPNHPDAAPLLREAAEATAGLLPLYRGYRVTPEGADRPRMGEFFFLRWRQYLVPYPVGGRVWPAPNPAHVTAWPRLDAALGHADQAFLKIVEERTSAMLPEEVDGVIAEFRAPSLSEVFLASNGYAVSAVKNADRADLARAVLDGASPAMVDAIQAFAELIEAAKSLTAAHLALIRNFIIRPSQKMMPEIALTRASDAGVSGRSIADTERLVGMRREHPVTELFVTTARLVARA